MQECTNGRMRKCSNAHRAKGVRAFVHSCIGAFQHLIRDHAVAAARAPHHSVRVHRVCAPSRPLTITAETAELAEVVKYLCLLCALCPSTLRQAQGRPEQSRGTTSSGHPEPVEGCG